MSAIAHEASPSSPLEPVPSAAEPAAAPRRKQDPLAGAHPAGRRSAKDLLAASKLFQEENRTRSWLHVLETFTVYGALLAATILAPWWYARLAASIVMGLTIVRLFILYHDYMHLAILRNSAIAKAIFYAFGVYVLTPPNVWRQTHNYHHGNTAKIVGSHVGSYMMVTTEMWKAMSPSERRMYKVLRHPATIFLAYFTVFMLGMCVSPFLRNPKKNWDSLLSIVLNLAASVAITWLFGWQMFLFAYFLPLFVATMAGAYLFYAQHDFPEMHVQPRESWEFTRAALESSSYMKLGPVMNWFTGNIGYHHVHHLNSGIPFYRLPEAMAGIPELQQPLGTTTLSPRDILRCLSVKLWDPASGKMVGYPD